MATTDAKSGFRLPWSADRNESDTQVDGTAAEPASGHDSSIPSIVIAALGIILLDPAA